MKKLISVISAAVFVLAIAAGCGNSDSDLELETEKPITNVKTDKKDNDSDKNGDVNDLGDLTDETIDAVITLTNGEEIELELYPDVAPKTVANFIKNVQEGFYSGTIFHRAIEGFVIQGGGYDTNYELKSVSETVEGEFESNGIENDLSHVRGVVSMARTNEPNSATTQFFIVQEDSTYLDGEYAAFGKVTSGMDVVDEIAESPKMEDPPSGMFESLPEEQFVIDSITILSDVEEKDME